MTINIQAEWNRAVNRSAILYLLTVRSVHEQAWKNNLHYEPAFVESPLGMGELRTHPDLGGLLSGAAPHLPGVTHGYILGYDVLVNADGVIFAMALGMLELNLRLNPPGNQADEGRTKAGAGGIAALSSEWQRVSVFAGDAGRAEVLELCRQALDNANRLSASDALAFNSLLDELEQSGFFDPGLAADEPAAALQLAGHVAARRIPAEVLLLLQRGGGAYLGKSPLYLLPASEWLDVHTRQPHLFEDLPSAVYFAADGGDGFLFLDADGRLGQGSGAVLWVDRGSALPESCILCAPNLAQFLAAVQRGEKPWKGLKLPQLQARQMVERLQAARAAGQVQAGPGAELSDLLLTQIRLNLMMPEVLEKLLSFGNGVEFRSARVHLWRVDELQAVAAGAAAGRTPPAYLIGRDADDNLLALSLRSRTGSVPPGWPVRDGILVRLMPGQGLQGAQTLKSLPEMVEEWLAA